MKSLSVILPVLFFINLVSGQDFLKQDFSGNLWPPPGWESYPLGMQWLANQSSHAGGEAPEAVFEGFESTGTVRLISPPVDLKGRDTVIVSFRHFADDNDDLPGPVLGLATRSQGGWHTVWETEIDRNIGPVEYEVLISNEDTPSQNFRFSFYLSGDMESINSWHLDDVLLFYPEHPDCKLEAIITPAQVEGPWPVKGRIRNLGNTVVENVHVSFESYSGVVHDSIFQDLGLGLFESFVFEFDRWWVSPMGSFDLEVNIEGVNGAPDWKPHNDTLVKNIEFLVIPFPRRPCYEEFTSSTCSACPILNTVFVPWCEQHPDIVLIKYQMPWPGSGDPYAIGECTVRGEYYGVNGIPRLFCNGELAANVDIGDVQESYDSAVILNSHCEILSTYSIIGNYIDIETNILAYQAALDVKVHTAVVEKLTTGNATSNGETEFHNVLMDMYPDGHGEETDLHKYLSFNQSFFGDLSETNIEEMDDIMVAVFIQDINTGEILQADYATKDATYSSEARLEAITLDGEILDGFDPGTFDYEVTLPAGLEETPVVNGIPLHDSARVLISQAFTIPGHASILVFPEDRGSFERYLVYFDFFTGMEETAPSGIRVYPNPFTERLHLEGMESGTVRVCTLAGKEVYSDHVKDKFIMDLSHLGGGVYLVTVEQDGRPKQAFKVVKSR